MGLKRFIKKMGISFIVPGGVVTTHIIQAIDKQNKTGKPFTNCLKTSVKETVTEDMPGVSHLYQAGRKDGRIQGTAEQAQRDTMKFEQLQQIHEEDRSKWERQRDEYEELLGE